MKRMMLLVAALAAVTGAEALTITSPGEGAVVPLLTEKQRAFMKMGFDERKVFFDDGRKDMEKEIKTYGSTPRPVTLEWKDSSGTASVTLAKKGAAKPFFTASVASNRVDVWNLEIAAEYEWSVTAGGETAKGRFLTEDLAPRLIRIAGDKDHCGVPNMRDIGGRVMPDGRRVRQGLVYRSSGLNNNAPTVYYSHKEILALEQEGKLAGMGELGAKYSAKLKNGGRLDKHSLRLVKSGPDKPGTARLTEEWRRYLTETLGIRTDIDLRSERERFGMTCSPLGEGVRFVHDWENYNGYSSVHSSGLEATKRIFRLMMDRRNYPLDFHCIGGADRTGTVASLLHGILGATDEDIWLDYQVTAWRGGVNDAKHFGWFAAFVKSFDRFRGETLSARIREFFRKSCGFTDAELDQIREILLEPADPAKRAGCAAAPAEKDSAQAAGEREARLRASSDATRPSSRLKLSKKRHGREEFWWKNLHEARLAAAKEFAGQTVDLVLLGDSITHRWDRPGYGSNVWERLRADFRVLNLGIGADHIENVLWRITEGGELDGYKARWVSLLIGTNNTSGYNRADNNAAGIKLVLEAIRARQPGARIILTAIPTRYTEANAKRHELNQKVNAIIRNFADGETVFWLDMNGSFPKIDEDFRTVFKDPTHPGEPGYVIWDRELRKFLAK